MSVAKGILTKRSGTMFEGYPFLRIEGSICRRVIPVLTKHCVYSKCLSAKGFLIKGSRTPNNQSLQLDPTESCNVGINFLQI
jgi:hypothetical protein